MANHVSKYVDNDKSMLIKISMTTPNSNKKTDDERTETVTLGGLMQHGVDLSKNIHD